MSALDYSLICDVAGKEKGNQDSAFFTNFSVKFSYNNDQSNPKSMKSFECILALVCDGVSGSHRGDLGSSFVIRDLSNRIMQYMMFEPIRHFQLHLKLKDFIVETNNALNQEYGKMISSGKVPKTTLVGALILGQWMWVFNLGDSRAYGVKDAEITQISIDHVGEKAHEITQAMGEKDVSPEIKVINWAYGIDISCKNLAFKTNYYLLLCSDGLTDMVSNEEIKSTLLADPKILKMKEKVVSLYQGSIQRAIKDNVSIIGIDLTRYIGSIERNLIDALKF